MSKHKALKILGVLSSQELKRFGSFLRKVYGGREPLIKLFDVLRKYHPDFDSPQLAHESLFRKIMPDKTFHEKRIFNEMSALRSAVEQFMIEEYLQENEHSRNALLLKAYKKHQLDDLFFSQLQKMKKAMDQQTETSYTWLEKMKLAEAYYYHPSTKRITGEAPHIYEAMEYLDHFYAIAKMQYACEVYNRNKLLQDVPRDLLLLNEIQAMLPSDYSICFHFYKLALILIEERDDSTYRELKAYFQANFLKIKPKDRLIIFSYLINHTSYGIKKGSATYNREMIDLYRFGVENEIMIIGGYFDVSSFENTVILFCKDEQYKWALEFIGKWKNYLRSEIRKDIVAVSEAYILFEQGQYNEAHQKMLYFEELDFHDHIRAHILLIGCYVELEQYDSNFIHGKCDNFARSARRSKVVSGDNERAVLNFVKMVKRLDQPGVSKYALLEELNKMELVFSKKWLTEKIRNL